MSDFPQLQRLVEAAQEHEHIQATWTGMSRHNHAQRVARVLIDALPELRLLLSQRRACEKLLGKYDSGYILSMTDFTDALSAILQQEQPK